MTYPMQPQAQCAPQPQPQAGDPSRNSESVERAYIAASRRHDRSYNIRLESAHKASRCHMYRTGRWLKITEVPDEKNNLVFEFEEEFRRAQTQAPDQTLAATEQFLYQQLGGTPIQASGVPLPSPQQDPNQGTHVHCRDCGMREVKLQNSFYEIEKLRTEIQELKSQGANLNSAMGLQTECVDPSLIFLNESESLSSSLNIMDGDPGPSMRAMDEEVDISGFQLYTSPG